MSAGTPLPVHHQERVRDLVRSRGQRVASELLRLPEHTVARACGGLGMRRGSILLVELALAKLDQAAQLPPPPP